MSVCSVTVLWTGFSGGPGTTVLNFVGGSPDPVDADDAVTAADGFATDIAVVLPTGVQVAVMADVNWYDEDTGALEAITAVSPPPTAHSGGGGVTGPLPSGACISWTTSGINRGRLVRGRSFIVPLAAAYYDSNGSLTGPCQTQLALAATNLIGATGIPFGVWSRPRPTPPPDGDPAGGAIFQTLTGTIHDQAAVLRSRRD